MVCRRTQYRITSCTPFGRRDMMLEWKERDSHRSARILCHVEPRRGATT
jgi:hypothetical protein